MIFSSFLVTFEPQMPDDAAGAGEADLAGGSLVARPWLRCTFRPQKVPLSPHMAWEQCRMVGRQRRPRLLWAQREPCCSWSGCYALRSSSCCGLCGTAGARRAGSGAALPGDDGCCRFDVDMVAAAACPLPLCLLLAAWWIWLR